MKFEVDVKDASALLILRNGGRKMAFAVVKALNDTIKEVQRVQRVNVKDKFTIRNSQFIERQIGVIKAADGGRGFANVARGQYSAHIQIGQKQRLLLSSYERGADRMAAMIESGYQPKGRRAAQPITGTPARPSQQSKVPESFTVKGLRFIKSQSKENIGSFRSDFVGSKYKSRRKKSLFGTGDVQFKRNGGTQWKGEHRTFILEFSKKNPQGGIYQRVGPEKDDIRLIYNFAYRQRITPRLKFIDQATETTHRSFKKYLRQHTEQAFRFAAAKIIA